MKFHRRGCFFIGKSEIKAKKRHPEGVSNIRGVNNCQRIGDNDFTCIFMRYEKVERSYTTGSPSSTPEKKFFRAVFNSFLRYTSSE